MKTVRKNRQKGFSLMELMIALTIIGIITVIGMKALGNQSDQARHLKALSELKVVQDGLAEFYLRTGNYPEIGSWEAMISAGSPLVARHMVPVNLPVNDPWGNPYEGKSTKGSFELKCAGKPEKGEELGPITITPTGVTGGPGQTLRDTATAGPADAAPAQAAPPQ